MEQESVEAEKRVVKILGIGGSGKNVLEELMKQGSNLELVAINTDKESLDKSTIKTKIVIGSKACLGKGANRNFVLGEEAARESAEEIKEILKDAKAVILVAGMCGGTGNGSTPVILDIALALGIPSTCVAFMPLKFEGEQCSQRAVVGVQKLKKSAVAVVEFSLQQILEKHDKNTNFAVLMDAANQEAAELIKITAMSYQKEYR